MPARSRISAGTPTGGEQGSKTESNSSEPEKKRSRRKHGLLKREIEYRERLKAREVEIVLGAEPAYRIRLCSECGRGAKDQCTTCRLPLCSRCRWPSWWRVYKEARHHGPCKLRGGL